MEAQHYYEDNSSPSSSSKSPIGICSPSPSPFSLSKPMRSPEKLGAEEPLPTRDKTYTASTSGCKKRKMDCSGSMDLPLIRKTESLLVKKDLGVLSSSGDLCRPILEEKLENREATCNSE